MYHICKYWTDVLQKAVFETNKVSHQVGHELATSRSKPNDLTLQLQLREPNLSYPMLY